jgi:hypothetical protein
MERESLVTAICASSVGCPFLVPTVAVPSVHINRTALESASVNLPDTLWLPGHHHQKSVIPCDKTKSHPELSQAMQNRSPDVFPCEACSREVES